MHHHHGASGRRGGAHRAQRLQDSRRSRPSADHGVGFEAKDRPSHFHSFPFLSVATHSLFLETIVYSVQF